MHLEDLTRVEIAISAIDAGTLEWNSWAHSNVVALGLAAIRNPLGDAVTQYLDHAGRGEAQRVVLLVSTWLIKARGITPEAANKAAWDAFLAWNDSHCSSCMGRGVVSFQQDQCPVCGGTGEKTTSHLPQFVRDGMELLDSALQWTENLLRAKMKA